MDRLPPEGERTPMLGNRDAGRVASAWHRTASSLQNLGLIRLVWEGDAMRAFRADDELQALAVHLEKMLRIVEYAIPLTAKCRLDVEAAKAALKLANNPPVGHCQVSNSSSEE